MLSLDSNTGFFVYFKVADGYDGAISFTVDGNGAAAVKSEDRYLVKITGISAHLPGVTHTVAAATANGTSAAEVSAMSCVQGLLTAEAYQNNEVVQNAAAALDGCYAAA
ncbi:MAG: hypothetical protein J6Z23_00795 [Lachnospiraceae bacterium]|nr:hypothetical protein [Lachnospiraceae bacterium]